MRGLAPHVLLACVLAAASLTVTAVVCSGPPGETDDPDADPGPAPFSWQVDLTDLPDALLSTWVADGANEAYAVGGSGGRALVLEWTGGDVWDAPLVPDDASLLWWVWSSGGDTFAVGERATVLRRSGGLWRRDSLAGLVHPDTIFYGVWGATAQDVWVVGGSFTPGVPPITIVHWNGLVWSVEDTSELPQKTLFKVWGTGAGDVWAVGLDGTILHRDANGWEAVPSPTTQRLIAVMGRGIDEVYAVGGDVTGVVVRWDGSSWSEWLATDEPLSAIWTAPGRALFVGGNRGYLARAGRSDDADPDAAEVAGVRAIDDVDFHALAGDATSGRLLAVGPDFLGGTAGAWNGSVASHAGPTAGTIVYEPVPDGGPPDAPPPDALLPDGSLPGPAEMCEFDGMGFPICAAGLECWLLATTNFYLCTQECATAAECGDYGPNACCKRPGFQTLTTVCIPESYVECTL